MDTTTAYDTHEQRMKQEREERKKLSIARKDKLKDIAQILGGTFATRSSDGEESHTWFDIKFEDNRNINFSFEYYPKNETEANSCSISGKYPSIDDARHCNGYNNTLPKMGVSFSRTAEAIAKDIQKRFLDAYTEVYNKVVAVLAEREQIKNNNISKMAELKASFSNIENMEIRDCSDCNREKYPEKGFYVIHKPSYNHIAEVEARSDGKVKLTIECLPDTAKDILQLIAKGWTK